MDMTSVCVGRAASVTLIFANEDYSAAVVTIYCRGCCWNGSRRCGKYVSACAYATSSAAMVLLQLLPGGRVIDMKVL